MSEDPGGGHTAQEPGPARAWGCAAPTSSCGTPAGWRAGGRCLRCRDAHAHDRAAERLLTQEQTRRIIALLRQGEPLTMAVRLADLPRHAAVNSLLRDPELAKAHARQLTRPAADGDERRLSARRRPRRAVGRSWEAFGESKTLAEWAKDPRRVVPVQTFLARVYNQGWDVERALTEPRSHTGHRAPRYTAFGETKSAPQWARDERRQVAYETLMKRLRAGWDVERALTEPPGNEKRHTAFGESKSRGDWLRDPRCQVSASVLHQRLHAGWDFQEALTRKLTPRAGGRPARLGDKVAVAFGETRTLAEWAGDDRCQVSLKRLDERLRAGWDVERALSQPPRTVRRDATHAAFGEVKTLTQWLDDERCTVSRNTLRQRIAAGWPVEAALTTPRGHALAPEEAAAIGRTPPRTYAAFGEAKQLSAWARDERCAVSYDTLSHRLHAGWDFQEALTAPSSRTARSRRPKGERRQR